MPPSKSLSARIAALAEEFPNWKHAECPLDEAESWTDDELRLYAYSGGYMLPPSRSKDSGKKNDEQIQEGLPLPPSLDIGGSAGASAMAAPVTPLSPATSPTGAEGLLSADTELATPSKPHTFEFGSLASLEATGVGRWYFDVDAWLPSAEEWALALAQLPTDEDRARVTRFVFEKDRKLAMGSRLLQLFCVRHMLRASGNLGIEAGDLRIRRTKEGKPYIDFGVSEIDYGTAGNGTLGKKQSPARNKNVAREAAETLQFVNFNFNATHHGSVVALACEPICVVGVDVVSDSERPNASSSHAGDACAAQEEFFSSFEHSFTAVEWEAIRSPDLSVDERYREFYLHWALKEAYIKAHGLGFGIELQDLSFFRRRCGEVDHRHDREWAVLVEGAEPSPRWTFHVSRIDDHHTAVVARAPPQHCHGGYTCHLLRQHLSVAECTGGQELPQPPFQALTFSQLLRHDARDDEDNGAVDAHISEKETASELSHVSSEAAPRATPREMLYSIRHGDTMNAILAVANTQQYPHWLRRWRRWILAPSPCVAATRKADCPSCSRTLRLPLNAGWPPGVRGYWTPLSPLGLERQGVAAEAEASSSSFGAFRPRVAPSPTVFALSDLHVDHASNMAWVEQLPDFSSFKTEGGVTQGCSALIVAGDVSHSLTAIEKTLRVLKGKFDEVFYTVGNHELWVDRQTKLRYTAAAETRGTVGVTDLECHSLDKLMDILELCDQLQVRCRPAVLRGGVVIAPLLSWYNLNFYNRSSGDTEPASSSLSISEVTLSAHERHFDCQCVWPEPIGLRGQPRFSLAPGIASLFAQLNAQVLLESGISILTNDNGSMDCKDGPTGGKIRTRKTPREAIAPPTLITFSHFIPVSMKYTPACASIHLYKFRLYALT